MSTAAFHLDPQALSSAHLLDTSSVDRAHASALWQQGKVLVVPETGLADREEETLPWQPAIHVAAQCPAEAFFIGLDNNQALFVIPSNDINHLYRLLANTSGLDKAALTIAVSLAQWHSHFSQPKDSSIAHQGWARKHSNGHIEFPRVDPAIICLVHDGSDRVLLGRQAQWPQGKMSVLAGFTEPGENLEETVAREVMEEVGIPVTDITYVGSQPWPYPRSLMIGFSAVGDPTVALNYADDEIELARWYTSVEVAQAIAAETDPSLDTEFSLPSPLSISRAMIDAWLATT